MVYEYPHNFGAVTAATATSFSLGQNGNFLGSANVPTTARIVYIIVRNNSTDAVIVNPGNQRSSVDAGERKRIEISPPARFVILVPAATVSSGDLTADIGIEGTMF